MNDFTFIYSIKQDEKYNMVTDPDYEHLTSKHMKNRTPLPVKSSIRVNTLKDSRIDLEF